MVFKCFLRYEIMYMYMDVLYRKLFKVFMVYFWVKILICVDVSDVLYLIFY